MYHTTFLFVSLYLCNIFGLASFQQCDGNRKIFKEKVGQIIDNVGSYPDKQHCEWLIQGTLGESITITFHTVHLEHGYDFLHVHDGGAKSHKLLAVLNGVHKNISFISTSNQIYMSLHTDQFIHDDGFNLTYVITKCPGNCGLGTCKPSGRCDCFARRHGPACQHKYCSSFCSPDNTINTCNATAKKCSCQTGFYGEECSLSSSINTSPNTWHYLSSWSQKFDGRMGHVSGYIEKYDVFLVHGGYDWISARNDLQMYNLATNDWTEVYTNATKPDGRFLHSSVTYDDSLIIFGGQLSDFSLSNELWVFNFTSKMWALQNNDDIPVPKLAGHTMTRAGSKLYIIGGLVMHNRLSQTMYTYDVETHIWDQVPSPVYGKRSKIGLYGHTASYYAAENTIVVFGGFFYRAGKCNEIDYSTSVWSYAIDTNSWSEIKGRNAPEHALSFHIAVLTGDYLIIQGGWVNNRTDQTDISSKTYFYNLHCHTWIPEEFFNTHSTSLTSNKGIFTPRYSHSAVLKDQQTIIIAGGYNRIVGLSDVIVYKLPLAVVTLNESRTIVYGQHCSSYDDEDSCRKDPSCVSCEVGSDDHCDSAYGPQTTCLDKPQDNNCPGICMYASTCEACVFLNKNCKWCPLTEVCTSSNTNTKCEVESTGWWGGKKGEFIETPYQCQINGSSPGLTLLRYIEPENSRYPDGVETIRDSEAYIRSMRTLKYSYETEKQKIKIHGFVYPYLNYDDAMGVGFKMKLSAERMSADLYLGRESGSMNADKVAALSSSATMTSVNAQRENQPLFPINTKDRYNTSNLLYYMMLKSGPILFGSIPIINSISLVWNETSIVEEIVIKYPHLRPFYSQDCLSYNSCAYCVADASCGWCSLQNRCMFRDNWSSCIDGKGNVSYLTRSYGECTTCTDHCSCNACLQDNFCAWDADGQKCQRLQLVKRPATSCAISCYDNKDKYSCFKQNSCTWCTSTQTCFPHSDYVMTNQYGQCNGTLQRSVSHENCSNIVMCGKCMVTPGCGWCFDDNDRRNGSCTPGDFLGPFKNCSDVYTLTHNSSSVSLNWTYESCPDIDECKWSLDDCKENSRCLNTNGGYECPCIQGFKGDGKEFCEKTCFPACDHGTCNPQTIKCDCDLGWKGSDCSIDCGCNGHSTCHNQTGVCDQCQNYTTGSHCESCVEGSYGNATDPNVGCSPCECNGHGDATKDYCDLYTGTCFCKNYTTGRTCSQCMQGFIGDPLKGGCYKECIRSNIIMNSTSGYIRPVKHGNKVDPFLTCVWVIASEEIPKHDLLYYTARLPTSILLTLHQLKASCFNSHLMIYDGIPPNPRSSKTVLSSPMKNLGTFCGASAQKQHFIAKNGVFSIFYEGVKSGLEYDAGKLTDGFLLEYHVLQCPDDCPDPFVCTGNICGCPIGFHGDVCEYETCPNNCSQERGQGVCDQSTQMCKCNPGFTGNDCNTTHDLNLYKIQTLVPALVNVKNDEFPDYGSTMVAYGRSLFVYGGKTLVNKPHVELLEYNVDSKECRKVSVGPARPLRRYMHCAFLFEGFMYIFGGITAHNNKVSKEMWRLNLVTKSWKLIWTKGTSQDVDVKNQQWYEVAGHTCTVINDGVYIVGGYVPNEGLHEYIAVYNLTTGRYSNLKMNGLEPTGMYGHIAIYDAPNQHLYMYGGMAFYEEKVQVSDRVYVFDINKLLWNHVQSVKGEEVPKLLGHSAHLINGTVYVIGGYNDDIGYNPHVYTWRIACNHWQRLEQNDRYWLKDGTTKLQYAASAIIDNVIYTMGGISLLPATSQLRSFSPRRIPPCYMYATNQQACLSTYNCDWCDNTELGKSGCFAYEERPAFCYHSNSSIQHGSNCSVEALQNRDCRSFSSCPSCLAGHRRGDAKCHWCRCKNKNDYSCRSINEACPACGSRVTDVKQINECYENSCETSSCSNCNQKCLWTRFFNYAGEMTRQFSTNYDYPYNCFLRSLTNSLQQYAHRKMVEGTFSDKCPTPCSLYSSCSKCLAGNVTGDFGGTSNCVWSEKLSKCISPVLLPLWCVSGNCGMVYETGMKCPSVASKSQQCSKCLAEPSRGWCATDNTNGVGVCLPGGFLEPYHSTCGVSLYDDESLIVVTSNATRNYTYAYALCPLENECINGNHSCRKNEKCEDLIDGYSCECQPGYRQKNGRCEPICNQGCVNGQCLSPDYCKCHFGWSSKNCSVPCECNGHSACLVDDPTECLNCTNNTKGASCELCKRFFVGDPRHGNSCLPCKEVCNGQTDICMSAQDYQHLPEDVTETDLYRYLKHDVKHISDVVCLNCSSPSEGKLCESCIDGYYVEKEENNKCITCACNGHAHTCNKTTGTGCACQQNTVSDTSCEGSCAKTQCTKCTSDYTGDPRDGLQCYYVMRKETSKILEINPKRASFFVAKPGYTNVEIRIVIDVLEGEVDVYITDTDKQFKVNLNQSDNDAHQIELVGHTIIRRSAMTPPQTTVRVLNDQISNYAAYEGNVFLVKKVRKRLIIPVDYQKHDLSKDWFYVGISTIDSKQTSKVLIYYRQDLPRIDLMLFFLVLIVILSLIFTGFVLGWKLRHDHLQQVRADDIIQQIETMANRPFALYQIRLDRNEAIDIIRKRKTRLSQDEEKKANKAHHNTPDHKNKNTAFTMSPLAIQPTGDNLACVTTVVLQYPENELSSWNLSLASTLNRSRNQQLLHVKTTHNAFPGRKFDTRVTTTSL